MEGNAMVKMSGILFTNLGRIVRSFAAEMYDTAGSLLEDRRTARLKAHLDWSEGAQRNKRLRR
jgi:hypothetical protein